MTCGYGNICFRSARSTTAGADLEHLARARRAGRTAISTSKGPSWVDSSGKLRGKNMLYFSRSSVTPSVPGEIYVSERQDGARFGPATRRHRAERGSRERHPAERPRRRARGRVLSSNRSGTLGAQDIWAATRETPGAPWSAPVNLGSVVNTSAAESRPSLSRAGNQLLFGIIAGSRGDRATSTSRPR